MKRGDPEIVAKIARTRQEALRVIRNWIEHDHNAKRPYSSLDHALPMEFAEQLALASRAVSE
jgi:hypothetical protein